MKNSLPSTVFLSLSLNSRIKSSKQHLEAELYNTPKNYWKQNCTIKKILRNGDEEGRGRVKKPSAVKLKWIRDENVHRKQMKFAHEIHSVGKTNMMSWYVLEPEKYTGRPYWLLSIMVAVVTQGFCGGEVVVMVRRRVTRMGK